MKKIIVAGAGPAGMMAAITAASDDTEVLLWEKKDRVGIKLSVTGKGRCNLTTAAPQEELIKGFRKNGRFLFSAFYEFSNQDLVSFFNRHGLDTKVERGLRVFPRSDKAQDVVDTLYGIIKEKRIKVFLSSPVENLLVYKGHIKGIRTAKGDFYADAVVVTTGGMSYPGTGSTGDGYLWASRSGHKLVEPHPGLIPLIAREKWVSALAGLSLKNVRAAAYTKAGKKINSEFGEMIFTHFGISGPIILTMSTDVGEYINETRENVRVKLDIKPALSEERLDLRLQRDFEKYANKQLKNALRDLLPQGLIPVIVELSGVEPDAVCNQIKRQERRALVRLLKQLPITVTGTRPIEEAIVTVGGVDLKNVNPKTMESKIVKGLYFAGEVLDVEGYTGGYNLQAAFSTGYLAGKYAVR
ncbi:MAG: NAD(P)/FAD-dependent oxidoreductase [Syntrophomonadaceae bacterium]|jgi:predicted Rossmann fold flavoprotein|nr:NAD(P)/FAD-dependent oxidoreductase [Syntrophomonadaceae bacterium]